MVDRICQARRTWGPHRICLWHAKGKCVAGPQPCVKGGRSPAQRTLDTRGRAHTLAHGWMRRFIASGHADPSGDAQPASGHGLEHLHPGAAKGLQRGQQRLHGVEHGASPAMVDRSHQAQQNAGPRISINALKRTRREASSCFAGVPAARRLARALEPECDDLAILSEMLII
jgi:hypothetical protein